MLQRISVPQPVDLHVKTWRNGWGYSGNITIPLPGGGDATQPEVLSEIEGAWKEVSRQWMSATTAARKKNTHPEQIDFWKAFASNNFLEFPKFGQLLMAMMATSANTSALERSYTRLEIITSKRRNRIDVEHLELIYLLGQLKDILPVREESEYDNAIDRLN